MLALIYWQKSLYFLQKKKPLPSKTMKKYTCHLLQLSTIKGRSRGGAQGAHANQQWKNKSKDFKEEIYLILVCVKWVCWFQTIIIVRLCPSSCWTSGSAPDYIFTLTYHPIFSLHSSNSWWAFTAVFFAVSCYILCICSLYQQLVFWFF